MKPGVDGATFQSAAAAAGAKCADCGAGAAGTEGGADAQRRAIEVVGALDALAVHAIGRAAAGAVRVADADAGDAGVLPP